MKKLVLLLFCLMGLIGLFILIGTDSDSNETVNEAKSQLNTVQPNPVPTAPESSDNSNVSNDKSDTSNLPTKDSSLLSPKQQEKYDNLSDEDRQEMLQIVQTTQDAQDAVDQGAQKYFELLEDDKRFEKLDAEAEALIEKLNRQLKEK